MWVYIDSLVRLVVFSLGYQSIWKETLRCPVVNTRVMYDNCYLVLTECTSSLRIPNSGLCTNKFFFCITLDPLDEKNFEFY